MDSAHSRNWEGKKVPFLTLTAIGVCSGEVEESLATFGAFGPSHVRLAAAFPIGIAVTIIGDARRVTPTCWRNQKKNSQ